MLPGPPHAEIRFGLEFRARPFHARVRRRESFDVELQVAQIRGTGGRAADAFFHRNQHARYLQTSRESDAVDQHAARKNARRWCAGQPERASHEPAHALRITNAHAIRAEAHVVAKRTLGVVHAPGKMQRATPGFRAHIFKIKARRIEYQVARDRTETCREIRGSRRSVLDVHAAGDPRPVQCPFERCIDLRRAACVQIRHVAAEKPQVQRAI